MSMILLLMLMITLHIIEDFHIQGIMAKMKQKSWWRVQEAYTEKYNNDYLPVLLLHGFEWAVFVAFPLMWASGWSLPDWFLGMVVMMGLVHSFIDHLKCNGFKINLIHDQLLHMIQILVIWGIYVGVVA